MRTVLTDRLVEYAADITTSDYISEMLDKDEEKVREVLQQFYLEWESVPCDPEGTTKEQDVRLGEILEKYEAILMLL